VVEKVVMDPERDAFIDVMVKPAAQIYRLDEVLVITSTQPRFSAEDQQELATSESLKGAEAEAIKAQQKASQIMAERLPGLADPNAPPDQQPYKDVSMPTSVAHPPQPLHPDRFTPGAAPTPAVQNSEPASEQGQPADKLNKPESKPAAMPSQPTAPRRNP
jgi:rod shape-determining protein MreC